MKHPPSSIARFAEHILGKPLYPYQREIAEAILASVRERLGHIITVMMSRQAGKNQLSAVLEAYLLTCMPQGTIVKAAPTFTPQIINSRLRLLSLLDTPFTRDRIWTSNGYIIGLAPQADPALLRAHTGPRVMFYSASAESNVVGATADLLLEIDEAQDVSPEKFNRDFRPMASTANSTTILYGTAWSDDTLLAHQRAVNLELEQRTGIRCHFEYDWRALAAINPAYRIFVEQEIARLGEDHPTIQTLPADTAPIRTRRDSTVITIGRVHYNELNLPCIEVVHHQWWTGLPYLEQYAATVALAERWGVRSLVIDATGLGAGLASLLVKQLGEERVLPFTFTRPGKSRLVYQLLSLLNSGRLKLYAAAQAPAGIYEECWQQLRKARYRLPAPEVLDIYVDPTDGHDDFLISLALLTEALNILTTPAASTLIRPRRFYGEEGRF